MSAGIEEIASTDKGTVEQSAILSGEEVAELTGETVQEEAVLTSDEVPFEIPEKMKGKSAEEIAKMYVELEKMKAKQTEQEGGEEDVSTVDETKEEDTTEEVTEEKAAEYQKYVDSYEKNGTLSEAEYAELAKAGYNKEQVDSEIEYQNYKKDKALNDVLEPLGGGTDKFKEVAAWAAENKTPEDIKAFNEALNGAPKLAQQALLKGLYAEFSSSNTEETVVHTNNTQTTPSKGYSTESEFFADLGNPAYNTDPTYNKKVQEKLAKTNTSEWSF